MDDDQRCSICGAPAVTIIDVDTDAPDWRCDSHIDDPALTRAVAQVKSLEDVRCIVCSRRAEVAHIRGAVLIGYCGEHIETEKMSTASDGDAQQGAKPPP